MNSCSPEHCRRLKATFPIRRSVRVRIGRLPLTTVIAVTLVLQTICATQTSAAVSPNVQNSSFAGYFSIPSDLGDVGAEWSVPTILESSHAGIASTWVGVIGNGMVFVQVGTIEQRHYFSRSSFQDYYQAFWSDSGMHFLPSIIGRVEPGDVVHCEITLHQGTWKLRFGDITRKTSRTISVGSRSTGFLSAEWLQEDPPRSSDSRKVGPYPDLSSVRFKDVTLDGVIPKASSIESTLMTTPSGTIMLASRYGSDSFQIQKADADEEQYIRLALPLDKRISSFLAGYAKKVNWNVIYRDGTSLARSLKADAANIRSFDWQRSISGSMVSLASDMNSAEGRLGTLLESGPSKRPLVLRSFEDALTGISRDGAGIRSSLGLPPSAGG
jgi:Peptidase A4 family